jgi:AcrR family transcriptional regulator
MAQKTPTGTDRPLRADAERNRERILVAAREAFAEDGLDVGLHEIAKRAGVGVGTVYRRFPDKAELIEALFEDRIAEVLGIAEEALAEDDAWTGLEHFLHRTCELQVADHGLHQLVFQGAKASAAAAGARSRIAPLVSQLVARAQKQGTIRKDIGALDVGLIRQQTGLLIEALGDAASSVWPRALRIALDGLRTPEPTPLPGAPPTPETFERVITGKGRKRS